MIAAVAVSWTFYIRTDRRTNGMKPIILFFEKSHRAYPQNESRQ